MGTVRRGYPSRGPLAPNPKTPMKYQLILLSLLGLGHMPVYSQAKSVTVVPPPPERVLVQTVTTTPGQLDRVVVRERLSVVPKAILVDPVPVVPPPPGGKVVTTRTVTTTTEPGRTYNAERSVVVVESRELPYVTVPVLFEKETDKLLDAESRAALESIAAVIREIAKTDAVARFDIEGHTSVEGAADFNMDLSAKRAKRIYTELTQNYGVAAALLTAHGYGENYPSYPKGNEADRQKDRRVLVVRTQ